MMQPKKRTKSEGTNPIQQFDEYLSILKRFGIPTSDSDTLEAVGPSPFILIFNTTLNKLRIFDGTIWKDASFTDLSSYYTKSEIDLLFQTKINGLKLEVNQLNSEVYLKDLDNNILSTINVGFLNNEGTSFIYNDVDNTLELYNESEELLTSIPVSSFLTNTVSQIIFNVTTPTILELLDSNNNVIDSVQLTISNVQGLQTVLNNLEPLITILPVSKGGTGKNTITENSFYVGGPANTLTEKTIEEVFSMLISAGNGLDVDGPNNIYVISANSGRITVNPSGIDLAQVAVTPGTYYKVTIDEYGRVVGASNVNINDFSAILNSIHNLTDNGFIVKNGTNTVSRIITGTSGRIVVSNQTGVNGNPQIDLSPVGVTPGTYNSVTVDDYGRVTAGTTINILSTVLSGFSLLVGGPVIDTDTIISAFGKIQSQINNLVTLNTTQTITGNKQFNNVRLIQKANTAFFPTESGGNFSIGGNSGYDSFDFHSLDGNDQDSFGTVQIYSNPEEGNVIRHTSLDNQINAIMQVNQYAMYLRHQYGGQNTSLYIDGETDKVIIEGTQNKFAGLGTSLITGQKNFEFPNKNGTLALISDLVELNTPQIVITTTVSISTSTLDINGYSQYGKNVIIDNGTNNINIVVNGTVTSYLKHGTGTITFVSSGGRTLVNVDSTNVLNGAVGSTAIISSIGTIDYLRISNV
jgi:hypothetical protein